MQMRSPVENAHTQSGSYYLHTKKVFQPVFCGGLADYLRCADCPESKTQTCLDVFRGRLRCLRLLSAVDFCEQVKIGHPIVEDFRCILLIQRNTELC